jgi:hypothetical protein
VSERPPDNDDSPEFDAFADLTKKLLDVPKEAVDAAEQELENPSDETDEG